MRVTARLLQRQGYEGTPIKQIAAAAEATLGSVYHFFPGGKQELAAEAIRYSDEEFAEVLRAGLAAEADSADAMLAIVTLLADGLRASDWLGVARSTPRRWRPSAGRPISSAHVRRRWRTGSASSPSVYSPTDSRRSMPTSWPAP
ncbi:AcrR family transcriptional regulator [Actinoalloteichus hymeniacidonis]|uniref:Transcriptional regulator, TetR family n=1 Tax=Actinoalloteichus hymeniacidonis TaxID=340345 RepID=A0AAC9HPY6_9PSEU|nr:TetR/AcrR family transcriptional regulator [Actinoalloteichus hymeniacidonis]AOS63477.1 transcriptional regulator, TetR family [Actinoalloteichus hymeniacidonis]MBB5908480.1 AcrR family transcriptional regulator [Actinoalloteichus hymeniacidonis]